MPGGFNSVRLEPAIVGRLCLSTLPQLAREAISLCQAVSTLPPAPVTSNKAPFPAMPNSTPLARALNSTQTAAVARSS